MSGYTKVFSSLIHSTIWREPDHVRIVWMTMLAMADRDGVVEASVPGLADAARKSIPETEDALDRLSSPDPYSRSPEHEGRRVAAIRGGWKLLNYESYRDRASAEEAREKAAARQARKRERERLRTESLEESEIPSRSVTPSHAPSREVTPVTQSHDIAEASPSPSPPAHSQRVRARPGSSIDCPDPLGEHETVSSSELPWRAWLAVSRERGMRPTDADRRRELRHVEDLERAILELAPSMAEARGMSVAEAAKALTLTAMRRFGAAYDAERSPEHKGAKRLEWRLGWVVSRWAELTAGAIPQGAA